MKVIFENATLRDVISKASKIAPTKGAAFDKSAGIHVTVSEADNQVVVRSNNTEVFYTEIVDTIEISGEGIWLIPSVLFDGVTSKLPVTSGAQVTLEDSGSQLVISHRRLRAKIAMMDPDNYLTWDWMDTDGLSAVADFAARLEQVSWAAARDSVPPLSGIHLDGEYAMATDNHRIATTPCPAEMIYEPVTIPASTFTPLMRNLGEVRMGRTDNTLLVMPDEATQIRATIFANKYPPIRRAIKRDEPYSVTVRKEEVLSMVEQASVMSLSERNPILKLIVGLEELAVMMQDGESGLLGNVAELAGQCQHDRYTIGLAPDVFSNALRAAPNREVTLHYHLNKKPIRIDGGSGYETLLQTRNLNPPKEES